MSKLTDIIKREVEGCVARQNGLMVTPAIVTAVQADFLRADVKLLGNGAEIKNMLNKTPGKLTVGQTVTVAYSTLPSSGVILFANGETDLIKQGGGGVEVDTAALLDSNNIHDWVAIEELMLDISADTKLLYGGNQRLVALQGYASRYSTKTIRYDDVNKFGTKIEIDCNYRDSGTAYTLKHYVIELFVNARSPRSSGGENYTFGFTITRYAQGSTTAESVRTFTTYSNVVNPLDAFLILQVSSMSFATSFTTSWSGSQTVQTPYGYVVCNNLQIQLGVLTEDSPTTVTYPTLSSGSSSVNNVYLESSSNQYRCVPMDGIAEKYFNLGLTQRSEPQQAVTNNA